MKKLAAALLAVTLSAVVVTAASAAPKPAARGDVKRGEYLVTVGSCNDCHTPMKNGPNGPERDTTRLLSGHPEALQMPPAPRLPEPWMASASATFTAWAGPWGVSFAANLTPDAETGLGHWTVQNFVEAMRTGRHQGRGRPILPPMPWNSLQKLTDADLNAIFAYLQSIPAVRNRVPDPIVAQASAGPGGQQAPAAGSGSGAPAPEPGR